MTDPAPAAPVRFCTDCGAALDESGACPRHGRRTRPRRAWAVGASALAVVAAVGAGLWTVRSAASEDSRRLRRALTRVESQLDAQAAAANGLSRRLGELETKLAAQPDPAAVARRVAQSVFTVQAGRAVGSAFVLGSGSGSSTLVTNYHVVDDEWRAGRRTVRLRQEGKELEGRLDRVSAGDDLAVIVVAGDLPPLSKTDTAPAVGDPVLVVGAPLGLGGSVSNGIVSAMRDGYIQFSAPIAPGNSGGPVVNIRGQVIGVARSKLVAEGAEGLSFAIPVAVVCTAVQAC